eukprot:1500890-Rhodomonas_salina.1
MKAGERRKIAGRQIAQIAGERGQIAEHTSSTAFATLPTSPGSMLRSPEEGRRTAGRGGQEDKGKGEEGGGQTLENLLASATVAA